MEEQIEKKEKCKMAINIKNKKKDGIVMWPRKEKENWWPSVAG